jgi:branched-chain amino acid aminotransferase
MHFAGDLGIPVEEAPLLRQDLLLADEAFYTGTAAEVVPIRSVDDHEIGPGPITKQLQELFFSVVTGKESTYDSLLDFVYS